MCNVIYATWKFETISKHLLPYVVYREGGREGGEGQFLIVKEDNTFFSDIL